jgi:hypothetical protein
MKCNHYSTSCAYDYLAIGFVFSFCTTCGFAPPCDYVLLTSSFTNFNYDSTSSVYIYDYSTFVARAVLICFCS